MVYFILVHKFVCSFFCSDSGMGFVHVLGCRCKLTSLHTDSYKKTPGAGFVHLVFSIDTDKSVAAIVTGVLLVLTITHLTIPPD